MSYNISHYATGDIKLDFLVGLGFKAFFGLIGLIAIIVGGGIVLAVAGWLISAIFSEPEYTEKEKKKLNAEFWEEWTPFLIFLGFLGIFFIVAMLLES